MIDDDDEVPDGVDGMDSDEEDEGQNVYYIDNENIMGINSPNTGQNTNGTYVTQQYTQQNT